MLNIVTIGGGTGLSTLLRGLKAYVHADGPWSIDALGAIVTVTDEGGSSGVLRKEFGMLPPGDIRNCIVALAEEEQLLSRLFSYRFDTDSALKGHSLGNLLLTAMTDITGSFDMAVLAASEVLAIRGEIYPSTLEDVRLRATLEDGTELIGEVAISGSNIGEEPTVGVRHTRITRLELEPPDVAPTDGALTALAAADLIIIGPGSLYTSVLPNIAIRPLAEALRNARALRVYICNVMTQPNETDGYSAQDHLRAIIEHAGLIVDVMVINGRRPSGSILDTYAAMNQFPVAFDLEEIRTLGVTPFFGDIIAEGNFVRHDPQALAQTIFQLYDRYGHSLERDETLMNDNLEVIILAAGLGTRMKSHTIKILHRAAGRPIIDYVLDLAAGLSTQPPVMVIGHQREAVQKSVGARARFAVQDEQLGTGHAVLQAASAFEDVGGKRILILSGDVPLTRPETLKQLLDEHERSGNALTLLTMKLDDPAMYGRIVRDENNSVVRIVEAKDASDDEKAIDEVNAGIYVFGGEHLFDNLRNLSNRNSQGEYYLTDLLAVLRDAGHRVGAVIAEDPVEALGVNSRRELAQVEDEIQRRVVEKLMAGGVTFRNPATVVIDSMVSIGPDTVIYPFVTLEGKTSIGRDCVIEPGSHLIDVTIGNDVHVKTGTVAENAVIEDEASVGPYAHLRPGSHLGRRVKIGNFVETKKAVFGEGAKASHLSYIGDAEIGADVNIGAGTITCNYDGVNKHKTILEDGVFIGSDTQLVAPVRVGRGAYVGAGSTITKDVPAEALALSRTPQRIVEGWAARKRVKKEK